MPVLSVANFGSKSRSASLAVSLAAIACVGAPPCAHAQVSTANSYYVPQSGPVATPTEGTLATRFFRTCPNNDVAALITQSARIKVVLRDSDNFPIAGVAAADICLLFNGGTAAQGFSGVGADSIIANSTYNSDPLCPDVTCVYADAPTDVSGVTYITFAGADPLAPGVGLRDPSRKWGHYDSAIPVQALGTQLSGRLTTGGGAYVLRIKNLDVSDGLDLVPNAGQAVTIADLASVDYAIGPTTPVTYWLDFDSSGSVNSSDTNLIRAHFNHDCDTPNNP